MESHGTSLHFSFLRSQRVRKFNKECRTKAHLHVNFVATQHDGNVFADTFEVTMPVWYVFVCDPRCDVEHDDTALTLDVIAIPEAAKLLLTSGIPDVEADGSKVG